MQIFLSHFALMNGPHRNDAIVDCHALVICMTAMNAETDLGSELVMALKFVLAEKYW